MNKKNRVFLTILIILGFIASCQYKSVKQDNIEINNKTSDVNVPTFLIYGELFPNNYAKEKDSIITQKFGFKIKRVADCEVTDRKIDNLTKINQKNNLIMKLKYGKNWKEKFEQETKLKLEISTTE